MKIAVTWSDSMARSKVPKATFVNSCNQFPKLVWDIRANFSTTLSLPHKPPNLFRESALQQNENIPLRRALNLAYQWGKLEKPVRVTLATGENQRERVLTENETDEYWKTCPQPWRDCATIIWDEGFRPSQVFALRWPNVFFKLLLSRYEAAGRPIDGRIFPSASQCGHFNGDAAKEQHKMALKYSGVEGFVPYTLRHTALTRREAAGGDVFVLALIAGHCSITVTQRYIHPQADAINRVFSASQLRAGTKLGTTKKLAKAKEQRKLGRGTA